MMGIIDFCKNVNIEVNLFDLIMVLITFVLITAILLVAKKTVLALKREQKTDERLRQTRTRISRVLEEMKEYNNETIVEVEIGTTTVMPTLGQLTDEFVRGTLTQGLTKEAKDLNENSKQDNDEEANENVPCIKEIEVAPSKKKTRAMSMEERWAEYNQKRSMRSTA